MVHFGTISPLLTIFFTSSTTSSKNESLPEKRTNRYRPSPLYLPTTPVRSQVQISFDTPPSMSTPCEPLITPFAQILASLHQVKYSLEELSRKCDTEFKDDLKHNFNEVDWCLKELERLPTNRSVSDMASRKFRNIVDQEIRNASLHEKASTSKQVKRYLNTYYRQEENDNSSDDSESNIENRLRPTGRRPSVFTPSKSTRKYITLDFIAVFRTVKFCIGELKTLD